MPVTNLVWKDKKLTLNLAHHRVFHGGLSFTLHGLETMVLIVINLVYSYMRLNIHLPFVRY